MITIYGVISDFSTKETLPGAHVLIAGSSPMVGTVTDRNGAFQIDAEITDSLIISFIGYPKQSIKASTLTGGLKHIELKATPFELAEATVTPEKKTPWWKYGLGVLAASLPLLAGVRRKDIEKEAHKRKTDGNT